jgi:hypothetical protein
MSYRVNESTVAGFLTSLACECFPQMVWAYLTPQVVTTRSHKAIFREIFSAQPEPLAGQPRQLRNARQGQVP